MKRALFRTLRLIRRTLNRLWQRFKALLGFRPKWPVVIATYRGYGRADWLSLRGRVLKDRRILARNINSRWRALVHNYRRFNSREIPGVEVEVQLGGNTFRAITDEEGYFFVGQALQAPLLPGEKQWQDARLSIRSVPGRKVEVDAVAPVLVPPPDAAFGVISDIDDTVLKTDVTSLLKLKVIYHTMMKSAALRQSFGAAAAFYQALQRGPGGDRPMNPIFYVSNSPWNLYDLLEEFLDLNGLPAGPILLRDFGIPYQNLPKDYRGHKQASIERIFQAYPSLPFVLIGDSGEKDPYIYRAVAEEFPGRVAAIYIRDVRAHRRTRRLARFIRETGADIKLVQNYSQAAKDAAFRNLLLWEVFEQIRQLKPG
ncbi:MAG: DUF2183 domain-containing protein [Phaeodactylibacter sp.]|nr:DUF2183 domain-containing protein [Phaeodactylibacter sp.]MCB9274553.1 DUF2183 domain-containing protein [Lewinellaceae bacterium]